MARLLVRILSASSLFRSSVKRPALRRSPKFSSHSKNWHERKAGGRRYQKFVVVYNVPRKIEVKDKRRD